ncbi:Thiamine biosynthesis protein [Neisseria gonorrhoeae]|nr:Thiamine biosynthesis protein [Neisseria gonorrhoeae]
MGRHFGRRRFLTAAAVAVAGAAVSFLPNPFAAGGEKRNMDKKRDENVFFWKGVALGSGAELRLFGVDDRQAADLVNKVLAEVARLEKMFSLYREDSLISRLNRDGYLTSPPADSLELLSLCRDIHALTEGAFDPTVQALWKLYADYFAARPDAETPPPENSVKETLKRVGFGKVSFDDREIRFAEKGMGLSLNGIAQGYITDKVVALLKANGVPAALVDMGEIRGFDKRQADVECRHPQSGRRRRRVGKYHGERQGVCHFGRLWDGDGQSGQAYPFVRSANRREYAAL